MKPCLTPALEIVEATRTRVVGRDADGARCTYVLSPTGWRLRGTSPRPPGPLVVDPWLIALLDSAAADAA